MKTLAVKLTAAFIVTAVLAVALVSYLANRATADQFASYVDSTAVVPPPMFRNAVAEYYERLRDWRQVQPYLAQVGNAVGARLVVTDDAGRVLADSADRSVGVLLSPGERASRVPLSVGGTTVGYIQYLDFPVDWQSGHGPMMGGMMGGMMGRSPGVAMADSPGTPERAFLASVNNAMWTAGGIAALLAAALGLLIVRQVTRPLSALTAAASRIAKGDLSQRVELRSGDEIGRLASAFNGMADSLDANERLRRQLVADIAHELRTPLSVIQGNLEAMRDGVVAPTAEHLASVHDESLLLARLVDDLRELSLAEAGQLPLQMQPVDLADLVQGAVKKVQAQAAERKIVLQSHTPAPVPPVLADGGRIRQVVQNLLANALRHTEEGGRIVVSVGTGDVASPGRPAALEHSLPDAGLWLVVSVADSGTGIPAGDLPHVFDRFYRVDKSRARASGGSGIGLAIVRQIVAAHDGQVWATSVLGKGSTFSFALPVRSVAPQS